MNRIIKFRIWDRVYKRMYLTPGIAFVDGDSFYWSEKSGGRTMRSDMEACLMQYTGLKDSEGKEIHEGDILASKKDYTPSHIKGVVELGKYSYTEFVGEYGDYNDEHYFYGWHCPTLTYCRETYNEFINGEYFIIGNIYENPELLEDKE